MQVAKYTIECVLNLVLIEQVCMTAAAIGRYVCACIHVAEQASVTNSRIQSQDANLRLT
jgi:hypothetical protein